MEDERPNDPVLDDRLNTIEHELLGHGGRLKTLEEQITLNIAVTKNSRRSQRRSEIALYGLFGFLIIITLGLKYQDGSFAFGIPVEIVVAGIGVMPLLLKGWQVRQADKKDDEVLNFENNPKNVAR